MKKKGRKSFEREKMPNSSLFHYHYRPSSSSPSPARSQVGSAQTNWRADKRAEGPRDACVRFVISPSRANCSHNISLGLSHSCSNVLPAARGREYRGKLLNRGPESQTTEGEIFINPIMHASHRERASRAVCSFWLLVRMWF